MTVLPLSDLSASDLISIEHQEGFLPFKEAKLTNEWKAATCTAETTEFSGCARPMSATRDRHRQEGWGKTRWPVAILTPPISPKSPSKSVTRCYSTWHTALQVIFVAPCPPCRDLVDIIISPRSRRSAWQAGASMSV